MASEVKLAAETRTEFGKGAARRIRRAARIPAVLYGHGTDPVHVSLPQHETQLALRVANVLLSIDVDGKAQLALPKQVQRDPIKGTVEHLDLIIVRRGEKVTVDVPVNVVGEAAPGAVVMTEQTSVAVEAEATHLPAGIEVSVEGAEPGTQIFAKDLELPSGATITVDDDLLIVNVTVAQVEPEPETEGEDEAEGEAEADAEGEAAEAESSDAE